MTTISRYKHYEINPPIQVHLPDSLTPQEFSQLLTSRSNPKAAFSFPALDEWLSKLLHNLDLQRNEAHTFHKHPYKLWTLEVQAVDWFWRGLRGKEDKLGFMKIQSKIETEPYVHEREEEARKDWLPGAVFLRGGSVAVLIIVQPENAQDDEDKYLILTVQPRIAAGSLAFTEIPAGMLDGGSLKGVAASEIEEEAKLKVKESDLINLSELALKDVSAAPWRDQAKASANACEWTENSIYPSVGACDEFIPILLCQKRLTRRHMDWLKGKATGLRDEGENITLRLVPLDRAWREAGRDAKALAAIALYDNLNREGQIPEMPYETEAEPAELS
ncbi:NUDIX domain-containing protein [Stagonosporopsis vannaccii]|nr:NUDIX domain-containing protein [Stagonosporopsis vannaccii]